MSTTTTNYGLTKQSAEEYYNVEIPNANMDIIDTTMKGLDNNKEVVLKNAAEKTSLADTDSLALLDSADSSKTKRLSFANFKTLLKTVFATKEEVFALNSSLNNTIKKDGSVQMTGALMTVGVVAGKTTKQVELAPKVSLYCGGNSFTPCTNAYYDGSNWRYIEDGKASIININEVDLNRPIQAYYAISGVKDAIITWIENSPLTLTTGLSLTGGTLTGAVTLDPVNSLGKSVIIKNASDTVDYGTQITDYNQSNSYASLVLMAAAALNAKAQLYVDGTWYPLYGTHNITVSTSAPGSALAEGAQHQVYA